MCSGWSYSPPCVAIKKSDLEPKSLGSLSASLSFSFCFFSVSVAQSGPPEKHMPVQQRGETKFLLLLLSWPEQTPHQVGKSASRLCQAKILVRPPLPPATPKIPQSCQIHSAAQFRLDSFFFFLLLYESLYVKSQKTSSQPLYLQDICSCPHLFGSKKVRTMAHFAPKDLTHLLLIHVIICFSFQRVCEQKQLKTKAIVCKEMSV